MTDERHSNGAEQERRIREAIRSAGDVRADAAFRERLKREFMEGTIPEPATSREEPRDHRLHLWWWVLVPAAAVVLLFAVLLPRPTPSPAWVVHAVEGEGQFEIDGQTLAVDQREFLAEALGSGGRIRLLEGVSLDLLLDDRLILQLDEQADVTVPVPPERGEVGTLISEVHHGELRVKSGPGFHGTELDIVTAEGRTEIVGTIVSVYKGDGFTCVCVLEGTAMIGADGARLEEIPQGMRKVMFDDGRPPMVTEIQPQHEAGLMEFEERYRNFFPH
jgi:ferric-dicitrate binding protein FerR (iron transport regulator)